MIEWAWIIGGLTVAALGLITVVVFIVKVRGSM